MEHLFKIAPEGDKSMRTKNPETFKAIEDFVNEYTERHGVSPTVREIHAGIGLAVGTVYRYLSYMRENGMIDFNGCRNITTREAKITKRETTRVPVLGVISCGVPKFAEENIEEYVRLPVALFGKGDFFILRANGDSMIEANIEDGDLVVIRQQNYAEPGQIVVALIEDDATLKRYYPEPEKRRVRLHPENSSMRDIYVKDCIMQDYKTIRSVEEIDAYIGNATIVAFDFETAATDEYRDEDMSALDAHKSDIAGISISVAAGTARYIPLRHRTGQNADIKAVMAYLSSRLFNSSRLIKVAHNLSFEAMFLYKYHQTIPAGKETVSPCHKRLRRSIHDRACRSDNSTGDKPRGTASKSTKVRAYRLRRCSLAVFFKAISDRTATPSGVRVYLSF